MVSIALLTTSVLSPMESVRVWFSNLQKCVKPSMDDEYNVQTDLKHASPLKTEQSAFVLHVVLVLSLIRPFWGKIF